MQNCTANKKIQSVFTVVCEDGLTNTYLGITVFYKAILVMSRAVFFTPPAHSCYILLPHDPESDSDACIMPSSHNRHFEVNQSINRLPGSRLLISCLPGSALEKLLIRSASLAIQQPFPKLCLVNLISKDTHQALSVLRSCLVSLSLKQVRSVRITKS